ncbi:MAG: hypothetical protein KC547_18275, partial [Anaerolineae bacterium]|nr:hypothetical protein [Anaerolineae bacterium]
SPPPQTTAGDSYVVQGHLVDSAGKPVTNAVVQIYDKDIGADKLLGNPVTDAEGYYILRYSADQLSRPGKQLADILIQVELENDLTVNSPVVVNANRDQTIDLSLPVAVQPSVTKYARVAEVVGRLVQGQDIQTLTPQDVQYLAAKTSFPILDVAGFVNALGFTGYLNIDFDPELVFGFHDQGVFCDPIGLIFQSRDQQIAVLRKAVGQNVIRPEILETAEAQLDRLRQHVIGMVREGSIPTQQNRLLGVFAAAKLNPDQREYFLTTYAENQGNSQQFWSQLSESNLFSQAGEIERTQFTVQLSTLTGNNTPLMARIVEEHRSLRDLVGLSHNDWKGYLAEDRSWSASGGAGSQAGSESTTEIDIYVTGIMNAIELALPTATFAQRLSANLSASSLSKSESIVSFLESNPDFDFARTSVATYLRNDPNRLNNIDDSIALQDQLFTVQRLFNITPQQNKWETIETLVRHGYTSAQKVVSAGSRAIKSLGLSPDESDEIYRNSEAAVSLAANVYAAFSSETNRVKVAAIDTPPWQNTYKQLARDYALRRMTDDGGSDWESLFGPLHLCACEHGQSMYSPAAYLVDILYFLMKIPAQNADGSPAFDADGNRMNALDVLHARRPDICNIELNCENTNTEVPYVDLVNEILENAVTGVSGTRFYQTKGKSDAIHIYPEHIDENAYAILADLSSDSNPKSIFSRLLPFNLWHEEATEYLKTLGVSRFDLANLLHRPIGGPIRGTITLDGALAILNLTYREF